MDQDKVQLTSARVERAERLLGNDRIFIRATLGSGIVITLCEMNRELNTEHAAKLAQIAAEAWRRA